MIKNIMISATSYVSISDLRDKTATIVKQLPQWKKIILSQNKPVGVFMSIDEYNALLKLSFYSEKATKNDIKAYKESTHWSDSVEAFWFLDSLK